MAATPSGKGYWLVTAAGGVFCFGDAKPHGSAANRTCTSRSSTCAATPSGKGYWLVTAAGGVFAYGDAHVHGKPKTGRADRERRLHALRATGTGWRRATEPSTPFGDAPVLGGVKAPTSTLVRC